MTESADGPYPIRPITEDEFDSFEAVAQHAFHGSPPSESDRHMVLDRFEFDRRYIGLEIIPAAGTVIGTDGDRPIVTPYDDCVLIMPSRRLTRGRGITPR